MAVRAWRLWVQALVEEPQDAVQGGPGRMASLIDQVDGQHRVRPGRDGVGVAGGGVDLDGFEGGAQLAAQGGEPLGRAAPIGGEPQPQQAQPTTAGAGLDLGQVGGVQADRGPLGRGEGGRQPGWLATGASTAGSTAMASANPPVRHMPIAPTPGPPHSRWAVAARARSQVTTGLVRSARTANSRLTHTCRIDRSTAPVAGGWPGRPNSDGRYTV